MYELSIVIAAYNEEKRLPKTLARVIPFLESQNIRFELVLVNDGSKDNTLNVLRQYAARYSFVRVITHFPNQGRGASIRKGVLAAKGEIVLETDADGSVADEAIVRFLNHFKAHPEIAAIFGSRELPDSHIALKQPMLRVLLGYGFIYLTRFLFWSWHTTDFTLGFKMFRQVAAKDIFARQFSNHYVAEAEIVYVAKKRGWNVCELPVTWTDNKDSRVRPFKDSVRSLAGLYHILKNGFVGKYR